MEKNIFVNSNLVYLKIDLDGIYAPHEYQDLLQSNFDKLILEKNALLILLFHLNIIIVIKVLIWILLVN